MDFIEQIFGVSPDGGSGTLKLLLFLIPRWHVHHSCKQANAEKLCGCYSRCSEAGIDLKSASVQRSAEGRVFDCEFVAYPQLRSTFLRTRRITAKVPPAITVNRYASQNIHLSFACRMPVVASPMSAQPESAHKQENARQDPARDAAPE
jgi:hypothetical protein